MSYRAILIGLLHCAGKLSLLVSVAFFVVAVLMPPEAVDLLAVVVFFFVIGVIGHAFTARRYAEECARIGESRLRQSVLLVLSDFLLCLSTVVIALILAGPEIDIPERYFSYAEATLVVAFFLHCCPMLRLKR